MIKYMKKEKKKYLTNREWTKEFKFNNHWFRLKSLFDANASKENHDDILLNMPFDFNDAIISKKSKAKFDFD